MDEEIRKLEAIFAGAEFDRFVDRPVAYFCAEYMLSAGQKLYSGGLGALAGDMLREASDRNFPLFAVGLYYHEGYACPTKESGGHVVETCVRTPPAEAGFEPVAGKDGRPLVVSVPIHDRRVKVRAWKFKEGRVPVYLLDADCDGNDPADRRITDRLYVGDKETRLKQEIVLGIGGLRVLEALDVHPSLYHLNEGHSALLALELVRHQMEERKIGFDEAKQFARRRIVLTNHTLVPAGQETYRNDMAAMLLDGYAQELAVPVNDLVGLGLVQQSSEFSMSMLAFRMSAVINAVSKLHARKAKEIWRDHPMIAVTNGVHVPTWDMVADAGDARGALWRAHQARKASLLSRIKEKTGREWGADDLLIGWARRTVKYKRPLAVFDDPVRLADVARREGRHVRFVFSGHPHPSDTDGQQLLGELRARCDAFKDIACYLPGYDMDLAKTLVSGCDIWLNTPVVGFEACGTSGMKAALNGALTCSTKDGWVDEADLFRAGWLLGNDRVAADLLTLLEKEILPLYHERSGDGVPVAWESHMRAARTMILDRFTATRMLREYVEMLYL
jgi:starch phosphorylase